MRRLVMLCAVAILLMGVPCSGQTEQLRITSPKDGAGVPHMPAITVTAPAEAKQVWLVVYPKGTGQYWVQPVVRQIRKGEWRGQVYIGRAGTIDVGKAFEILAVGNPADDLREGDQLTSWPEAPLRSQIRK
jgi:hypothetical protein